MTVHPQACVPAFTPLLTRSLAEGKVLCDPLLALGNAPIARRGSTTAPAKGDGGRVVLP